MMRAERDERGDKLALQARRLMFQRLERRLKLEPVAGAALAAAAVGPWRAPKGQCVSREADRLGELTILFSGLMLSSRRLSDGRQQHVALRTPGDVLDHPGFVLGAATVSTTALTSCCAVSIPRRALADVVREHPAVETALQREMALAARVAQEWMVSMGRRSAYARVAHLVCEIDMRLRAVDMAGPAGCLFPLTQSDLADLVGLSVVHVNRVLQQLRGEGLVKLARGHVEVREPARLRQAADFDPAYLHLETTGA